MISIRVIFSSPCHDSSLDHGKARKNCQAVAPIQANQCFTMSDPSKLNPSATQLSDLRSVIRLASYPDNPALLRQFLLIEPDSSNSIRNKRAHYNSQFRLLIDTIADDCLPGHWRCACLDQIYRPLHALRNLADCTASRHQVTELYAELRVIANYFQASMIHDINNSYSEESK